MKTDNKGGQQLLATPTPPHFSIPLNFPPNVFRQANLDSFTNIVGRIRERIQKLAASANGADNHAIELYGGVGTIGLHISDIVSSLVSSDENPNNAKCFFDSVRTLPATLQSRLEYKQKNAADMVLSESALFQKSKVLIVDPPRKGLDDEVVDYLCGDKKKTKNLELIVYVSCGFQAFQRDCDALVQSGRWRVEFAEGYLLFPGADAIETLAFFVPV
jgi:tRNA/tmRNA/rRNA uracil-C5-methylase (TrmA/RlmC/RlmD family)